MKHPLAGWHTLLDKHSRVHNGQCGPHQLHRYVVLVTAVPKTIYIPRLVKPKDNIYEQQSLKEEKQSFCTRQWYWFNPLFKTEKHHSQQSSPEKPVCPTPIQLRIITAFIRAAPQLDSAGLQECYLLQRGFRREEVRTGTTLLCRLKTVLLFWEVINRCSY